MHSVMAALNRANVPGYRSAFRATDGMQNPPDTYCVFTCTLTPAWASDDGHRALRQRVFLHLYARSDPTPAQAAIHAAMTQEGYTFLRQTDDADHTADLYEIQSEWEKTDAV